MFHKNYLKCSDAWWRRYIADNYMQQEDLKSAAFPKATMIVQVDGTPKLLISLLHLPMVMVGESMTELESLISMRIRSPTP